MPQHNDPPQVIARRNLLQVAGGLVAAMLADARAFDARAAVAAAQKPQTFTHYQALTVAAIAERIWPGAEAAGVVIYIDRALMGVYSREADLYRSGLLLLDQVARRKFGIPFAAAGGENQDAVLRDLEAGGLTELPGIQGRALFEMLRKHVMEGVLSDPIYGGNRDFAGWKAVGYPGPYRLYTEDDQTATTPLNMPYQSIRDL